MLNTFLNVPERGNAPFRSYKECSRFDCKQFYQPNLGTANLIMRVATRYLHQELRYGWFHTFGMRFTRFSTVRPHPPRAGARGRARMYIRVHMRPSKGARLRRLAPGCAGREKKKKKLWAVLTTRELRLCQARTLVRSDL